MRGGRVGDPTDGGLAAGVDRLSAGSPLSPRAAAGLVALLPVALATLYRVALNAPGPLPPPVTALADATLPLVVAGPALAGLVLAATADRPGERVGFAFVGGFGLVSVASPAAWLPAVVGTVLGGGLAVGAGLARDERPAMRRAGVAVVLAAGVVTSLAATAGVESASLRPLGSGLALVGVGLTPLLVGGDRSSLAVGALAGVLTFALATSAPFVAGAVLLVGGGVLGAPLGLVAFAVGGGVAGGVRALRRERGDLAVGAGLLLAAGVPATLPRALGVVVALALLVETGGEPT